MNWEKNILGFVREDEWLNVGFNVTRPSDPIDGLFGDDKTDNIAAKWQSIASEYQIPVMAQFHGFDTESLTTFRVPVDSHNIEKGLIKVKINQSERMRQLIRTGVREDALYDYVLNDGIRLADQVFTRSKVAKNELMASGKVTIKENNLNLTVDYGVPANQVNFTLDFSEGADVMAQMQTIKDAANDKGVTLNGMLTSGKNITKLRKNAGLQKAINGNVGAGVLIRKTALDAFFSEEFGINTIITNDLTYGADAEIGADGRPVIHTERYFPENKVTFFATNPAGRMGVGLWGNPPEVDATNFYDVKQSGASPFVYVMQWMETDPAVLWTKASGLFMPVLYNPNSLFIATVADGFLDKVTVAPEDGSTSMWGTDVSDMQTSLSVANGAITGTLKYLSSGQLVTDWGAGNFMALKFSGFDANADKVLVGLTPSVSSGLVDILPDPDKNGVFKVTNKNEQKLVVISTSDKHSTVQTYDLSGLTVQSE